MFILPRAFYIVFSACMLTACGTAQPSIKNKIVPMTPFEKNRNQSATYIEAIAYYKKLANQFAEARLIEAGDTDSGFPLHSFVIDRDKKFTPSGARKLGKAILFINNGIHPGEPCGIDASMMFVRDVLNSMWRDINLDHLVLVVIPVYNISGSLNRNTTTRANQNGPDSYGFRGNRRNYDLNRDFIKCDTENATSFNKLFTHWSPDIMVDTHTSNGADYTYTMTLISTQKDKLAGPLASYLSDIEAKLYDRMEHADWEMTPYVYSRNTPDDGIMAFLDSPRYSSGYAALHHTIAFMPETHMLKPFQDRVMSTYHFLRIIAELMAADATNLIKIRSAAIRATLDKSELPIRWELDTTHRSTLTFKGYEAGYKVSEVTGMDRLFYDRSKPYQKQIPYLDQYRVSKKINLPAAYIIPGAYKRLIHLLEINGVQMEPIKSAKILEVEMYKIQDLKTVSNPYEGHYLHTDVSVETIVRQMPVYAGDVLVPVKQDAIRYIVETLEPEAMDSFFAWNFFDAILQQKEYFSPYVFEDTAVDILNKNPELKNRFKQKKQRDSAFGQDPYAQLTYIYTHSPHYERSHRMYPIMRLHTLERR